MAKETQIKKNIHNRMNEKETHEQKKQKKTTTKKYILR